MQTISGAGTTDLYTTNSFVTTPEFWLNLQRHYDLEVARNSIDVDVIEPLTSEVPAPAAA